MEINIIERQADFKENKINITVEAAKENPYKDEVIGKIKNAVKEGNKKVMVYDGNIVKSLEYKDIIMFYSENKNNYCRTKDKSYKVKSPMYELQEINTSFVRISKNRIINTDHVDGFEHNIKGKIVAKLDDRTQENVSRRQLKQVMKFIQERSI